MTKDTLSQIRERAEKASPGPWRAEDWGSFGFNVQTIQYGPFQDGTGNREVGSKCALIARKDCGTPAKENAEFAAHARTDIPALLAYVEKLERVAQAARGLALGNGDEWEELYAALRGLEE